MRVFIIILLSISVAACSRPADPCQDALNRADLLINQHVKFEVSIARVSEARKLNKTARAEELIGESRALADELEKLDMEYALAKKRCGQRL